MQLHGEVFDTISAIYIQIHQYPKYNKPLLYLAELFLCIVFIVSIFQYKASGSDDNLVRIFKTSFSTVPYTRVFIYKEAAYINKCNEYKYTVTWEVKK